MWAMCRRYLDNSLELRNAPMQRELSYFQMMMRSLDCWLRYNCRNLVKNEFA